MPIDADLIAILVCPETKQPVAPATPAQLLALNNSIGTGNVFNRGGAKVPGPISEGLVRQDGRVLYPIEDGIPVMLVEESIGI